MARTEVSDEDICAAVAALKDVGSKADDLTASIKSITKKVEDGEISTSKGISFLEVKHHLLLSYLINLTHLMLRKVSGEKIEGLPDIDRLVEIRTVLEKIRPIDRKLKYQVDKVIKTAVTGDVVENNPLRFKPNPENMTNKLEDEGSESEEDEKASSKPKKYVPPKLVAVHYDGDSTQKERLEMRLHKARKKALSSSIMQDLKEEYYQGPEEILGSAASHLGKAREEKEHRTDYEEDYFVRLSMPKKKKNAMKRMQMSSGLDDITKFGDVRALSMTEDDVMDHGSRKRKKGKPGKKGKKMSRKKRKF